MYAIVTIVAIVAMAFLVTIVSIVSHSFYSCYGIYGIFKNLPPKNHNSAFFFTDLCMVALISSMRSMACFRARIIW